MEFQDTYTSTSDQALPQNKDKKIISDDAFAIGELLDKILTKIFVRRF